MVNNVIDEIITGMAATINKTFNNKYPIYTNNQQQSLEKPCFFIKDLNGERNREIGLQNRFYKDELNFVIIGYTLDGNTKILNDMIENLCELEYIELSDKTLVRADKLHHKIEDGILHFFVDYKLFIKKNNTELTKMNNYNLNEEVNKN